MSESLAEPLTEHDLARVDALLVQIAARIECGDPVADVEKAASEALERLLVTEAAARDSFSAFYASLAATPSDEPNETLPPDVAGAMGQWAEARRAFGVAAQALLASTPVADALPIRRNRNTLGAAPAMLRVPTAATAKDAIAALFSPHLWRTTASGDALAAQVNETHLRVELDEVLGFGAERAIQQIARQGASIAQTFLTLAALWQEKNAGQSHETYLTVYASDLLRFQGRRETPKGGYHRKDLLAKGRDIYLLSRISVPKSDVVQVQNGERSVQTLQIGRLLSLESLEAAWITGDDTNADESTPGSQKALLRFRYHLGREVYEWIGGDTRQYTQLSSRLLAYHPIRQKYQVLLGFCLAYYDRVNRKNAQSVRRIRLTALLNLAAIPIPDRRIGEFLSSIEDALNDLARDGVIPGLKLEKPDGWPEMLASRRTREVLQGAFVVFPRMLQARGDKTTALPTPEDSPCNEASDSLRSNVLPTHKKPAK